MLDSLHLSEVSEVRLSFLLQLHTVYNSLLIELFILSEGDGAAFERSASVELSKVSDEEALLSGESWDILA